MEFRLPTSALRRQYLYGIGAFALGSGIAAGSGVRLPIELVAFSTGTLLLALAVTYYLASHRVWVTVLSEGIQGRGIGGGKSKIDWSAQVIVMPVSPPHVGAIGGLTLLRVGEDGTPFAKESVFVPRAIYESVSFQSAVKRFAPVGHPILRGLTHAT